MPVEALRHIETTPVLVAINPIKPPVTLVLNPCIEQVQDALRKTAFRAKVAEVIPAGFSQPKDRSSTYTPRRIRGRRGGRSRRCSRCNGRHSSFGEQCKIRSFYKAA